MQIKVSNTTPKNSNSQPSIAAHLQGTQSQCTEANLAKELQLLTHGKQLSIQQIITTLNTIKYYSVDLSVKKTKRKNKGLRPVFFPFSNSLKLKNGILLPL